MKPNHWPTRLGWVSVWCAALLIGASYAGAQQDQEFRQFPDEFHGKADDALLGQWAVISAEAGGKSVKDGAQANMRFIFKDDRISFAPDRGPRLTTVYVADTKKTPRTIDILSADLPRLGIYKVEKDRLTVCLGGTKDRPTEFSTKEGDHRELLIFRRETPSPAKNRQR